MRDNKLFIFSYIILCCLLIFTQKLSAQCNWNSLGPDDINQASFYGVSYTDIATDNNGNVYIAFADEGLSKKATVRKFDGLNWTTVGNAGFTAGRANDISITIDPNGVPYIVFQDYSNGSKASVMKFNGSNWANVGPVGISTSTAGAVDIAINNSGTPYIIFTDVANGSKASVMKYNGINWSNVGVAGFSVGAANYTKICINGMGTPYVAYQDVSNGSKVAVMSFNGTAWSHVGSTGFSLVAANYISLALDASSKPYVVYEEGPYGAATAMKFDGTNWGLVGARFFSAGDGYYCSIYIGTNGIPYTIFRDNNFYAIIMKFNGSSWVNVGSNAARENMSDPAICVDNTGTPFVTFADHGLASHASVLKFNGSIWEDLGSTGFTSQEASSLAMARDSAGTPYVSFKNNASSKIRVMKYADTSWINVGGPIALSSVVETDIAVDRTGTPYIVTNCHSPIVMKFNGSIWALVGSNISNNDALSPSIALDSVNAPYVSYSNGPIGTNGYVRKFNGSSWITVGGSAFSNSQIFYTDLAVRKNGTVFVAFSDGAYSQRISVKTYNGSFWTFVGTAGFSAGSVNYPQIILGKNDTLYTVYSDNSDGAKATVKKFNGSSWVNVGNPSFTPGGAQSLAIDFDTTGIPYVSFIDMANDNKATVMKLSGSTWVTVGAVGISAGGIDAATSLIINGNNKPVLAYSSNGAYAKFFDIVSSATLASNVTCLDGQILLSASGGASYSWSGPDNFTSAVQSPTISNITFSNSGTYSVSISDPNCGSSFKQISVTVNPTPSVTVNNGVICSGESFTINPSGASSYIFAGSSAIVSPTSSATYTTIGTDVNGCSNSAISTVIVNILPTVTVNSGAICAGQSFTIVPSGADTYTITGGADIVNPFSNMNYSVTGTDVNGCSSFAISTVTVNVLPTVTVNSGAICVGQSFTMVPSGADTYTITGGSDIVSPIADASYSITGTDINGCVSTIAAVSNVTVNALPTLTVNSGAICSGQSFTIMPSGASTYTFSGGSDIVSPVTDMSYSIIGTDINGCVSSIPSVSNVTVNALPIITVNDGIICNGQTFTITPSGASTYTFSGGTDIVNPTVNMSYSVTGTDINGCESLTAAVSNVTVNALPVITASTTNTILCVGETATLTASGPTPYTWSTSENTSIIVVSPTVNTVYSVSTTDANNCSNTALVTLSVSTCTDVRTNTLVDVGLLIYPNPTNGMLNISFNTIPQNTKIELYNSIGALVLTEAIGDKNNTVNVSELSSAIYFMKVLEGNKVVAVKKVVKE